MWVCYQVATYFGVDLTHGLTDSDVFKVRLTLLERGYALASLVLPIST